MVAMPADAYRPFRGVSGTAPASRPAWPPRPAGGRRRARSATPARPAARPPCVDRSSAIDLARPQHHPAAGASQRQAQLERHRRRCQRPRQHQVEAIAPRRSRVLLRTLGDHRRRDPQLAQHRLAGTRPCATPPRAASPAGRVDRQRDAGRAVAAAHVHDQRRPRLADQRQRPRASSTSSPDPDGADPAMPSPTARASATSRQYCSSAGGGCFTFYTAPSSARTTT